MPKLQIVTPDGDETRYALDIESVKIGRNDSNDIIVDEDSMSGDHAELNLRAGGNYEVTDVGSTNGTRVNGAKISEPVLLTDGDEVRFGSVEGHYISELEADVEEELPPQEEIQPEIQPEIADLSSPPQTVGNLSAFGPKDEKKDPLAITAVALAVFGIVLSGAAALMALKMTSGG